MGADRLDRRVAELLQDAREAATQRDWSAVRALAESVLALDPASEPAKGLLEESRSARTEPGEWRQLTVLFCDVVGSTTLAAEHDPEVVREILRSYQTTTNAVVRRYDGHIANYVGDGVLAYFGYPTPHEDDARRAIKAGLDLLVDLRTVAAEAKRLHDFDFAVRIAVHTGMVVRADMGPPERPDPDAVVGEAPNVAARLQSSAQPGTLIISDDTRRLVQGYFKLEPLGNLELRGMPYAVGAYQVSGETAVAGPLEAQSELSPFIDRQAELERLSALWREVVEGGSAVIGVRGQPGIGKSRLLDTVQRELIAAQGSALPLRCSTFQSTTHLYPARRLIGDISGIDLGGELAGTAPRLHKALARLGLERHLAVFGALLGLPPGPECPAPELDGQALREATLAALLEWFECQAKQSPQALMVDDLQWADPSTLELLDRLIARRVPRMLVLLAGRGKFEFPSTSIEVLELRPLSPADLDRFAALTPAAQGLSAKRVEEVIRRSDGVPLFLEELLRVQGGSGGTPATLAVARQTAIPPALLDPLLARLTAPGVDLELVQTAACIGQEVRHDLLAAVVDVPEQDLRVGLDGLVEAGLLNRDDGDAPIYRFHHHLLRELAYDTQLKATRRQRHARIADALRQRLGREHRADAGRLAQHLERAGRINEAIEAYVEAADMAQSHGAFAEATEVLDHALELTAEVPVEQARLTLELTIRRSRGFSMVASRGYAAPEAAYEHERCFELSHMLEPGPEHLPDLIAVWSYYLLKGDLDRAEDVISVERRRIGGGGPDEPPDELFTGYNRYFRGDFSGAVADLRSYLDSDYARAETASQWPLPNDPTVAAWGLLAVAEHLTGDPVAAQTANVNAEARAVKLPFPVGPFSMGYAKAYACFVSLQAADYEAADAEVAELLELAERHGFMFWSLYGHLQNAIATLRPGGMGDPDAVTQALALFRIAAGEVYVPGFLTEMAQHLLERGDLDRARAALGEAEAISRRSGARFWAAETARVLGECRFAAGDTGGVEELHAAADLASRQGALVFELRARLALASVVGGRERTDELARLVDAFGDRPAPPELDAARQLLSGQPLG